MSDKIKEELAHAKTKLELLSQAEASLKFKIQELDDDLNGIYEDMHNCKNDIEKMERYLKEQQS